MPPTARPAIHRLYRFQWEPAQQAHVLLYPEGMVKLNQSAGEILKRCDGTRSAPEHALDILKFKLDILWSMNDAMALRYGLEGGVK